jgi:hypothetical protein
MIPAEWRCWQTCSDPHRLTKTWRLSSLGFSVLDVRLASLRTRVLAKAVPMACDASG